MLLDSENSSACQGRLQAYFHLQTCFLSRGCQPCHFPSLFNCFVYMVFPFVCFCSFVLNYDNLIRPEQWEQNQWHLPPLTSVLVTWRFGICCEASQSASHLLWGKWVIKHIQILNICRNVLDTTITILARPCRC